ncbi:MAG: CooT family nickel-binding protein [Clostridia bacterium]|nr:CooT family nickel-binding protein [Clostridia bacterium]
MCLSTVYKNTENPENVLMSNVARIELRDNKVIITDLMEREQVIDGDLLFVDLLGAKAIIKEHI